jgi:hypothetical protein
VQRSHIHLTDANRAPSVSPDYAIVSAASGLQAHARSHTSTTLARPAQDAPTVAVRLARDAPQGRLAHAPAVFQPEYRAACTPSGAFRIVRESTGGCCARSHFNDVIGRRWGSIPGKSHMQLPQLPCESVMHQGWSWSTVLHPSYTTPSCSKGNMHSAPFAVPPQVPLPAERTGMRGETRVPRSEAVM